MKKKRPQTFADVFKYIDQTENDFFGWAYETGEILPLLVDNSVSVVGISICTLSQLLPALVLCKTVKKYRKDTRIVLGGAFLRYIREPIVNTPEIFDYADYIVFGRGEGTLAELYNQLTAGGEGKDTPGVTYRENNCVISSKEVKDLAYNRYSPPDYTAMNIYDYLSDGIEISYSSSSGCYWGKCAFCSETNVNKEFPYLVKSADIVCKELLHIYNETGIEVIEMMDNALPVRKALKIAEFVIENKLPLKWSMLARAEYDFGPDELAYLYKGGLRFVSWGIETFNPRMQEYIHKGIDLDHAVKILKWAHGIGIWNHLFMIIGFPTETKVEMMNTLEKLEYYQEYIDSISLSNYHLHRNTSMFMHPELYNITLKEDFSNRIDTSYWYEAPDIGLGMPIEGLYGLFELYLSNFHFHTSNFRGFSTAKIVSMVDQYGKMAVREIFHKESLNKTMELAEMLE